MTTVGSFNETSTEDVPNTDQLGELAHEVACGDDHEEFARLLDAGAMINNCEFQCICMKTCSAEMVKVAYGNYPEMFDLNMLTHGIVANDRGDVYEWIKSAGIDLTEGGWGILPPHEIKDIERWMDNADNINASLNRVIERQHRKQLTADTLAAASGNDSQLLARLLEQGGKLDIYKFVCECMRTCSLQVAKVVYKHDPESFDTNMFLYGVFPYNRRDIFDWALSKGVDLTEGNSYELHPDDVMVREIGAWIKGRRS